MDYTTLGRTGLRVSVMGLGAGGPSRLGQSYQRTEAESVAVVKAALDCGVNFIDTAENYRTEGLVGKAIRGRSRQGVVLSTKKSTRPDTTAADVLAGCEASLQRLGTDYIDLYHMHGVRPEHYPRVRDELYPALERLREQGKIRFPGITELFGGDSGHSMLQLALADDCWDVVMVGFNILNQSARERVFAITQQTGVGTLIMFAVRKAFSRPERLREILQDLADRGEVDADLASDRDPLGFAVRESGAADLAEVAYRFCRHEPGCDVILSGTGNADHARANAESLCKPALPPQVREKLEVMFAGIDQVSGG